MINVHVYVPCFRRIEHLESNHSSSMSSIPTLHVDSGGSVAPPGGVGDSNIGIRTLSHNSLDGSTGNLHVTTYPSNNHQRMSSPDEGVSSEVCMDGGDCDNCVCFSFRHLKFKIPPCLKHSIKKRLCWWRKYVD